MKAVVQPVAGVDAEATLAAELMAWAREHLAAYKCPRSIDFDASFRACPPEGSTSGC